MRFFRAFVVTFWLVWVFMAVSEYYCWYSTCLPRYSAAGTLVFDASVKRLR